MKRKVLKYKAIYQMGGDSAINPLLQLGSQAFEANSVTAQGRPDVDNMMMGSALSGAGTGFAAGNAVFPGIGGLVGGAVGGIVGGISGNIKGEKALAAYNLAMRKKQAFEDKIKNAELSSYMKNYGSKGFDRTTLFANGGDINSIVGGYMQPLAPDVAKVKGRSHKAGGVDISTNGNPVGAEVEGEEVIHKGHVFSKKLRVASSKMSYADMASQIAKTPYYIKLAQKQAKLEEVSENPRNNMYKVGTATRNLQKIVNPLDKLFNMQEAQKQIQGIPPAGIQPKGEYGLDLSADDNGLARRLAMLRQAADYYGQKASGYIKNFFEGTNLPPGNSGPSPSGSTGSTGAQIVGQRGSGFQTPNVTKNDLNQGIGAMAPFLDNIVNASLTKKTPPIPTPTYVKSPLLNTRFNIEPQLAQVNRAASARNKLLTAYSTNPQVSRANILAGTASDIQSRNQLIGQKENTETQLKNQQQMIDYENRLTNAGKLDNYSLMKMQRTDDIHRRTSMNAANLSEDLMFRNRDIQMGKRDQQSLALIAARYEQSGVLSRSGLVDVLDAIEGGATYKDVQDLIAKKKKEAEEKAKAAGTK